MIDQILALPIDTIAEIHRTLLPHIQVKKKSEAARNLADLCAKRGWTITQLTGAVRTPQTLASDLDALDRRVQDGLTHQAIHISSLKNDVNSKVSSILTTVDDLNNKVSKVVDTLAQRPVVEIPKAEIDASIAKAIADAFGAFKSQVVAAGAERVVADAAAAIATAQVMQSEAAFGLLVPDAKGKSLAVTHWHRADAPAVDPYFVWHGEILRHLLLAEQAKASTLSNIWLGGEKGAGKSETARQFAARTGRGFTRINFQRFTTVEDFLGATGLTAGSTGFVPGAFLLAYTTPGSVILLDEITNADPGVLNALNGFLEPGAAVNYGGKVWTKAPGVMILAADNTLGNGDQSGRYAGTRAQGAPLLNRFGQIVHLTFMPRQVEEEAVILRTGCQPALASHVLDAIGVARGKVQQGEIIDAPSIRNVIAFIEAMRVLPVRAAWDATVAASQPAESAVALQQVFETCINPDFINSFL
jgi:MoxR-like ATPase